MFMRTENTQSILNGLKHFAKPKVMLIVIQV